MHCYPVRMVLIFAAGFRFDCASRYRLRRFCFRLFRSKLSKSYVPNFQTSFAVTFIFRLESLIYQRQVPNMENRDVSRKSFDL